MIRTYKLKHNINACKQDKIRAVLRSYRRLATKIAGFQWRLFFTEIKFDKMMDIKDLDTALSERYKRNCCYQVEAALKSFVSNIQLKFVKIVQRSTLGADTKKHLFQINRRRLWLSKDQSRLFPQNELFLAKKIFKHLLDINNKPSFRHANMLLNTNVAQIKKQQKDKANSFDYWIKLSTLDAGKPIMLPIKSSDYFDSINGKILNSVQVIQSQNGLEIAFMKDVPASQTIKKQDKVAIDIGLKVLFATNDGNLFGNDFYARLVKYDTIITELAKNRQRQGLKTSSPRCKSLVKKLRAFIKNEICRNLNRIVELYSPKTIVIERLNFQNSNLSPTTNRLLSCFGKGLIEQKLTSISERFGIEIQKVNPAYTSQECHKCHYVAKNNRKDQKHFVCKSCGKVCNADVNAARNNLFRSSDGDLANIYVSKNIILQTLVRRFLERLERPHSWASGLLCANPYFKGALDCRQHSQPKQGQISMVLQNTIE